MRFLHGWYLACHVVFDYPERVAYSMYSVLPRRPEAGRDRGYSGSEDIE